MPSDQTVDFVVMFLTVGLVVLGLLSLLAGWGSTLLNERSRSAMHRART
jgi:hypothetical protein